MGAGLSQGFASWGCNHNIQPLAHRRRPLSSLVSSAKEKPYDLKKDTPSVYIGTRRFSLKAGGFPFRRPRTLVYEVNVILYEPAWKELGF